MGPWRILIFPGGTEVALELRQALMWCKDVTLFSSGADVSNHAPFVFERHFILPSVDEAGWLERLQSLISEQGITHIFPAHDDAVVALAEHAEDLSAVVVTSPLDTCIITRSKTLTLRRLSGRVPTPTIFQTREEVTEFPVFLKPDKGQGSARTDRARDRAELDLLLSQDPSRIILEDLPGSEFTVDCFSDREAGLLYVGGRERCRTRSGIAMSSRWCNDPCFVDYASRICDAIALRGAWFFQLKADRKGLLKLMEVAPRIGGTSALSRARGVNLPLLSLYEAERIPVTVAPNEFDITIDRALVNRFQHHLEYDTVYVDLDDTLLVRGRVNQTLAGFIYQCLNRRKRIVLLTRHEGSVEETLRRYRLSGLFDDVIFVPCTKCKSEFIREGHAIFIDDSFSERTAVATVRGIPTFDCSMIDVLLDERR